MAVNLSHRDPNINANVLIKEPLRVNTDISGKPCGLAEFKEDEVVQVEDGGTGADTPEGARKNLEVFSETEITDLIVHNIVYTTSDYVAEDYQQVIVDTAGAKLSSGEVHATITLPTPLDDREVVVVTDGALNAQDRPIKVIADKPINGDNEFIIDVNGANVIFRYFNNEWRAGR